MIHDPHLRMLRKEQALKELTRLHEALRDCTTEPIEGVREFEASLRKTIREVRREAVEAKRNWEKEA